MKGSKKKGNSLSAEKVWVAVRVTQAEKLRLKNQADVAGLSVSEFLRRNFFWRKTTCRAHGYDLACGTQARGRFAEIQF